MSFGPKADRVLQYAKARAKLGDFGVDESDWPHYPRNPDDLSYTSIHVIADYCDSYISCGDTKSKLLDLEKVAMYYDAASADTINRELTDGELILAAAAYYLLGNYGSCLVAIRVIHKDDFYGGRCSRLVALLRYLLGEADKPKMPEDSWLLFYMQCLDNHRPSLEGLSEKYVNWDGPEERFFGKLLCVVSDMAMTSAARNILPSWSGVSLGLWKDYLLSKGAPRILWRAQEEIVKSSVLTGRSIFIQLPTGSGKTKSIELVLRARILARAVRSAVVIAPFLALCAEIETALRDALADIAVVYRSTYSLEVDSWLGDESNLPTVMVFTPEKYSFISRHADSAFDDVDLYVMDEAHVIADASRGPLYELTVSEILFCKPRAQLVMISAVLPNPEDFAGWAMGDVTALVSEKGIPSSEKAVGFAVGKGLRISYRDMPEVSKESFFVPLKSHPEKLKRLPRETKDRVFPDLKQKEYSAITRDKAIYLANIAVKSGGVAIYVPKTTSFRPFYKRLEELYDHGCMLDGLSGHTDVEELQRFTTLFELHYGSSNGFEDGLRYGVLPHYSNLPGCIRQCVERAIQYKDANCVACTSTLAQGVNLPIKTLLVTGTRSGISNMRSSDFKNLIGRTARPGEYSEGSILIVDSTTDKSVNLRKYATLFEGGTNEMCRSAVLGIFDDVVLRKGIIKGDFVYNLVISNSDNSDLQFELLQALKTFGAQPDEGKAIVSARLAALNAIETYLSQAMSASDADEVDVSELCRHTLAFVQAEQNSEAQKRLLGLFDVVKARLSREENRARVAAYAKTQMGVRETDALYRWCASAESDAFAEDPSSKAGINALCTGFRSVSKRGDEWLTGEQLARLVRLWLQPNNIGTMVDTLACEWVFDPRRGPNVGRIEKRLSGSISFELSNYVSCIADLVELEEAGELSKFDVKSLRLLHRKLKYGVGTVFECLFCERVIDDRLIANRMMHELGLDAVQDSSMLESILRLKASQVESILKDYPRYCLERFHEYLGVNHR